MQKMFLLLTIGLWLANCGYDSLDNKNKQSAQLKRAWDADNNPKLMDTTTTLKLSYHTNFERLPLSARLPTTPWSGDYWPTFRGGITYRWYDEKNAKDRSNQTHNVEDYSNKIARYGYNLIDLQKINSFDLKTLSPAEKLDIFLGFNNFDFTNLERQRTKILKTVPDSSEFEQKFTIDQWEGLCHAWAPATLLYKEPLPITLKGPTGIEIPFGSSDIKALLIYALHYSSSKIQFLGLRCNVDLNTLQEQYDNGKIDKYYYQQQRKACDDTNAGSFHIVLANQIARQQQGFIVDITRDKEVWNQPVFGYDSKVLKREKGASVHAAKGTVEEVTLKTTMHYIDEVDSSWQQAKAKAGHAQKKYTYRLELDKDSNIIGGEWLHQTDDRPDFMWKKSKPHFNGILSYIEYIYQQSIAQYQQRQTNSQQLSNNDSQD